MRSVTFQCEARLNLQHDERIRREAEGMLRDIRYRWPGSTEDDWNVQEQPTFAVERKAVVESCIVAKGELLCHNPNLTVCQKIVQGLALAVGKGVRP